MTRQVMIAVGDREGVVFVPRIGGDRLLKADNPKRHAVNVLKAYIARKSPGFVRKIKKALSAQRKEVIEKVATGYAKRMMKADIGSYIYLAKAEPDIDAIVQQILDDLDLGDVNDELVATIRAQVEETFATGADLGLTQVGFETTPDITKQVDEAAVAFAEERAGELIVDFEQTTVEGLRSAIADAVSNGSSVGELAADLQDIGIFSDSRAETIARTELAFAHTQGNVEGWRQTGQVEGKQSVLGDMHPIDDICDECADAGVVALDDDFVDGYDYPPFHPNCECVVVPVLMGEGDNSDSSDNEGD